MGQKLHNRVEIWKKQLLDFGKRNRLINFLEGKRNNVTITSPSFDKLWDQLVINEKELEFPYARKVQISDDGEEICDTIIKGDIETNKPIGELQKTLKSLRYKANTSIEEQGINTLYLTFGMLKWKEQPESSQIFSSPIILVPVRLLIESITSPYRLTLHDDEIVINPTLAHKLDNDFGISVPEFDSAHDSPEEYMERLFSKIENQDWSVERSVHLANLSFLKINMYKDLERNEEKLNDNGVISAIVGEQSTIQQIPDELNNFDHDKQVRPIDTFQVVDADSSQQDAILLSKKGASFVLQGPPGTGKSQTITNIIAEAIADGKKVLFVSEKMAALQVVYNRLASVGLADFCLTLHSHKANKKEILNELANSINVDRTRVREEALAQLELLERKRNVLNEYQEELHTPASGLNVSIYTIQGRLAKLGNAPDVIFPIDNVDDTTNDVLNERIYVLGELSKTISKRSEDYLNNVWRNSTVRYLSNELRHDIDSKTNQATSLLNKLGEQHSSACSKLGIQVNPSLNGNATLVEILNFAAKSPVIPEEWVFDHNADSLIKKACEYKESVEEIQRISKKLKEIYNTERLSFDATKCKDNLTSFMSQLQNRINSEDGNQLTSNIDGIHSDLLQATTKLNDLFTSAEKLGPKLGIPVPKTINQIISFVKSVSAIGEIVNIRPTRKWFDTNDLNRIKSDLEAHKTCHNSLINARQSILSRFDNEILSLDFYPILQRFRGDYSSFLRVFKKGYHNDLKHLTSYLSQGGKLSYEDALSTLNSLKLISDNQTIIDADKHQYEEVYGEYYQGVNTQWDIVLSAIDTFRKVLDQLHSVTPEFIRITSCGQLPSSEISQFNMQSSSSYIDEQLRILKAILKVKIDETSIWDKINTYSLETISLAEKFIEEYNALMNIRNTPCDYESAISDLDLSISLKDLNNQLARQKDKIRGFYKDFYNGLETNWDELIEALKYAAGLKELATQYSLPDSFVKAVCNDKNIISYCGDTSGKISALRDSASEYIDWFASLFNNEEDFYQTNILDLSRRMSLCRDKKYLLEEWVDYCSNREKCDKLGLGTFIKQVEGLEIDSNYITDAYLKRFYRLWLDAILPKFPAVQDFRGRIQAQTISEFCELDKGQFKIARARVRERALSRIPDFNSINVARDEIAILKRELNKQRRLMPLRKLFMTIPNLITALRPCFMMSPLSVSVFLEAQSYNFDLVIFDEASQVHTEDAIGAIMRGKQTIIVGDTKQLPPTSFFSASLNDEDYDIDSDETVESEDAGAFESVLDEAVAVLPERSLRWHYRSRDEHLIAFSNVKVYNSQLITFPSSIESAPDTGVEYIYVKDGVYDRGGKKNNIIEAKKVADLVFEHFRKYPNRSLGVVTFSEAQQNAVDAAIRQRRLQDSRFDKFFIEDKEEPFFIKNLENVQGDERDTIIFSIGYAKDSRDIMYMNFGPLSREGGYRRLNVAITRAKYNVKLVGSITANDIDLDKTSSEGVRMLRSYIEFAQQGIIALEKELTYNYNLDFDSPFEEAVYDFLQSKGYNVVTQVGCSGFRIDMAVKDPINTGKFVIGIECDGATYHSSRTARERDRLRQTILEDMGWTIYRIWSTDWIKDQTTEEEKLVNAIEKALGANTISSHLVESCQIGQSVIPPVDIEEIIESTESQEPGYGFDMYKRANPFGEEGATEIYDTIFNVISIEQPIHFEELCRRVAPLFGRQKVTSVVRNDVSFIFKNYLKGKISVDKKEFVRIAGFDNIRVRIPNPEDDYIRPIAYICDEELALAMKVIVTNSYGITPDDLFIVTAREFGFKRTGENITTSLQSVYKAMLKSDEITEVDGKVQIAG